VLHFAPVGTDDAATLNHLIVPWVAVEEDARLRQNAFAGGPLLLSFSTAAQAGTQVFGMGQMALHLGASNSILHSVHILGSTTNLSVLKLIAPEGHSNSHAPHWVHCEAMILKAMIQLLWFSQSVCQVAAAKASS